jgi:hypothetical protein
MDAIRSIPNANVYLSNTKGALLMLDKGVSGLTKALLLKDRSLQWVKYHYVKRLGGQYRTQAKLLKVTGGA